MMCVAVGVRPEKGMSSMYHCNATQAGDGYAAAIFLKNQIFFKLAVHNDYFFLRIQFSQLERHIGSFKKIFF